jgi:hypothetical protein
LFIYFGIGREREGGGFLTALCWDVRIDGCLQNDRSTILHLNYQKSSVQPLSPVAAAHRNHGLMVISLRKLAMTKLETLAMIN